MRIAPLLALLLLALSCGDGLDGPPETIADHVRQDPRLSLLEEALAAADLLDRLDEPGAQTLFAPTDAAFEALYAERGIDRSGLLDRADLGDVFGHHIVDRALSIDELERLTALAPVAGPEIHVRAGVDGIRLDDETRIVAEPIAATNGVIYLLDAVLDRPLIATTRAILVPADLEIATSSEEGFGITSSVLAIEEPGVIHDLQVVLDIEADAVGPLFLFLVHEPSNTFHPLVRGPRSADDDMVFTLADSAPLDVQSDVFASEGGESPAYPEDAYRPFEPLELLVGAEVTGLWELQIFNTSFEASGRLREWGLVVTFSEEPAAPAISFTRSSDSETFARGFSETAGASFRRVGGLEGPVEIGATTGDIDASPTTVGELGRGGQVILEIGADAELGDRDLVISAAAGEVSRIRHVDAEVVDADTDGIEMLAHVPLPELGGGLRGNDIWGWTDPQTGAEYALMGTSTDTAFVDISDPGAPVVVGVLPTHTFASDWRDIKIYQDHAFVVSEAPGHGLQVYDLTQLRGATAGQTVTATAHLPAFGNAHNIAIDEVSGFAYVVGATESEEFPALCSGGLLIIDIQTPASPQVAGCFAGGVPEGSEPGPLFPTQSYTHDAQCLVYNGPDADHQGAQICITSDGQSATNENAVGIADVTDKGAPAQISRIYYEGAGYTHQGWLTDDHRYFILNDEFDELFTGQTVSYVFDLTDLDAPRLHGVFANPRDAIGHNTYVEGNVAYQANYTSGLRLVDISDIDTMGLTEIAYFDTFPRDDRADDVIARCSSRASGRLPHPEVEVDGDGCGREQSFSGAWSSYPFFDSGVIAVSDINRGLFLLRPTIAMP